MKKFIWCGGESRYNQKVVDYMILKEGDKELIYVESAWSKDEDNDNEQQMNIWWDCLNQLAESELNLPDFGIDFEYFGNPVQHFKTIKHVPISLQKYLKKYFEKEE